MFQFAKYHSNKLEMMVKWLLARLTLLIQVAESDKISIRNHVSLNRWQYE